MLPTECDHGFRGAQDCFRVITKDFELALADICKGESRGMGGLDCARERPTCIQRGAMSAAAHVQRFGLSTRLRKKSKTRIKTPQMEVDPIRERLKWLKEALK